MMPVLLSILFGEAYTKALFVAGLGTYASIYYGIKMWKEIKKTLDI